jgi:hypothetical protein
LASLDGLDLLVTLSGTDTAPGEIDLVDLAAVASALQELSTRVGRELVERSGPGRTTEAVVQMTRLRLTGLTSGSTALTIGYGTGDGVLPFDDSIDDQVADLFWEVLDGIARNQRPGWAGQLVADSAVLLNKAFERTATRVTIERGDGALVNWRPKDFLRSVWHTLDGGAAVTLTVAGRLTSVDLASGQFRMVDDFGRTITLDQVVDPEHAAQLIGQRAIATGTGVRDRKGDVRRMESVELDGPILPDA